MKIAAAAMATLVIAAPVFAADAPANPLAKEKVTLDLRGLDLASVDGQQRLAIRMDEAARAVCGDRVATIHLSLNEQSRACQAEVAADIRSKIEARSASAARNSPAIALAALR